MPDTYKYDVFISYARKDGRKHAEKLEEQLQAKGYTTWRDKRDLNPHQNFTGMIEEAIENSQTVIVCVTPDVKRTDSFVRRELTYADARERPIIPLMINPDNWLPLYIVNLTYIDFTPSSWQKPFKELQARLTDIKAGKWVAEAPTPPDDIFREYCKGLYTFILEQLNTRMMGILPTHDNEAVIPLDVEHTPDAVQHIPKPKVSPSRSQFSYLAGIEATVTADTPKFDNFHHAFDHHKGRVLLLGDPGAGKTTTLFAFARDAVNNRLADPNAPLPILLTITTWNEEAHKTLLDWVLWAEPDLQAHQAELEHLINNKRVLFLLDGLDELGDHREKDGKSYDPRPIFIENMIGTSGGNQTVVSCRIKDYQAIIETSEKIPLNGAITLQSLDDAQLQTYLQDLPELWEVLKNDENLREVARTPLLLSLFTVAFDGFDEEAKALRDLTQGDLRDAIFRAYIERRYDHEARKYALRGESPPFTLEQIYEVLGHVAMEDACAWDDNRVLLRYFDNASIKEDELANFIEFMIAIHLLVDGGMVKERWRGNEKYQSYRFIHLLLRDYLIYNYCEPRLGESILHQNFDSNPAQGLGRLGDARTVEPLIAYLQNENVEIRRNVAGALGELGDSQAVVPLISLLQQDDDEAVRFVTVATLGTIGDKQAVIPLLNQLQHDNDFVRSSIIRALGVIGDIQVVDTLLVLLRGEVAWIRDIVAEALGELGDVRAVKPLIANLHDKDGNVRKSVIQALGKLRDIRAVKPLITELNNNVNLQGNLVFKTPFDVDGEISIAEALGQIGDTRAIEPLIPLLNDQSSDIFGRKLNQAVRSALQNIGTPEALEAIQDAEDKGWFD